MRVAADRVDAQMAAHMRATPSPARGRPRTGCSSASTSARSRRTLIRAAKRMADRARVPWLAVHVVHAGQRAPAPTRPRTAIAEALRLAEEPRRRDRDAHAESDVARELLGFARARNVSRLVIGRPRPRRWSWPVCRERVTQAPARPGRGLRGHGRRARRRRPRARTAASRRSLPDLRADHRGPIGCATLAVAVATLVTRVVDRCLAGRQPVADLPDRRRCWSSIRFGLWPSLLRQPPELRALQFLLHRAALHLPSSTTAKTS